MTRQQKVNRFIDKAKNKLFQSVGFDSYCQRYVDNTPQWYSSKSWSPETEEEFRAWFVTEIKKDLKLSDWASKAEVNWFLLSYGWKTEKVA